MGRECKLSWFYTVAVCAVVCLLGTIFGLLYSRSAHPPGLVWVALCFSNILACETPSGCDGLDRRALHTGDAKIQQLLGKSSL